MKKSQSKKKRSEERKPLENYVKYSAIGFQMAAIIGGGVYLGYWLDGKSERAFPLYTVVIGLFSIFAALYLTLKELIGKDK